jgi:PadR family transcriptional regulator PadR
MEPAGVQTQLRRGVVEFCVLALLRRRERYALELVKALTPGQLLTSEGTLYPLLSRLRRDGLVTTTWTNSAAGPPRRYYRITASGDDAISQFERQWKPFRDAVDQLLEENA